MEQHPSSEENSASASQEILCILWNLKVHDRKDQPYSNTHEYGPNETTTTLLNWCMNTLENYYIQFFQRNIIIQEQAQ
jgi:hypothetical protein